MTRENPHPDGRNAQEVVEALAQLFEADYPDGRAEAEEELREAGTDPLAVGDRLKRLAAAAAAQHLSGSAPARPIWAAAGTPAPTAHGQLVQASARLRSGAKLLGASAAVLVVFVLGYVAGRNRLVANPLRLDSLSPGAPLTRERSDGSPARRDVLLKNRPDAAGPASHGEPTPAALPQEAENPVAAVDATATDATAMPGDTSVAEAGTTVGNIPKFGEVITKANLDTAKNLISPGIEWCVEHGLIITIGRYKKVEWNKAYQEATSKYVGQTKLATDGRSLIGYVAGLPFSNLDVNDPQIASKIMWNYEYKPYVTDDEEARNLPTDTGKITGDAPMQSERHFLLDRAVRQFYTGRLYVDPQLPNPDFVRSKSSFHPLLEPFDLKGVGLTSLRYLDPDRQDDTWLYLPSLRRVRRLSSPQRSDALFGQDADLDSVGGFAGQIPAFNWKYLGERDILASFHSRTVPAQPCNGGGDFIFCDTWEIRKAYVVEGTPKEPHYAYGKRILFIDKDSYLVAYSDVYDRAQQLWKVWVNQWSFRRRSPFADHTEYADEMPFNPSFTMVDIQRDHATRGGLGSSSEQQRWLFNQGATNGIAEDFFTVRHLIASGN